MHALFFAHCAHCVFEAFEAIESFCVDPIVFFKVFIVDQECSRGLFQDSFACARLCFGNDIPRKNGRRYKLAESGRHSMAANAHGVRQLIVSTECNAINRRGRQKRAMIANSSIVGFKSVP
jgi:hypothetical protein